MTTGTDSIAPVDGGAAMLGRLFLSNHAENHNARCARCGKTPKRPEFGCAVVARPEENDTTPGQGAHQRPFWNSAVHLKDRDISV